MVLSETGFCSTLFRFYELTRTRPGSPRQKSKCGTISMPRAPRYSAFTVAPIRKYDTKPTNSIINSTVPVLGLLKSSITIGHAYGEKSNRCYTARKMRK